MTSPDTGSSAPNADPRPAAAELQRRLARIEGEFALLKDAVAALDVPGRFAGVQRHVAHVDSGVTQLDGLVAGLRHDLERLGAAASQGAKADEAVARIERIEAELRAKSADIGRIDRRLAELHTVAWDADNLSKHVDAQISAVNATLGPVAEQTRLLNAAAQNIEGRLQRLETALGELRDRLEPAVAALARLAPELPADAAPLTREQRLARHAGRFAGQAEVALGTRPSPALPPGAIKRPDFVCIGAQKAGTSWLYENLAVHPEVQLMPPGKEINYFGGGSPYDEAAYLALFEAFRDKATGDISPAYAALDIAGEVARLLPQTKIIYLLRNPIHRSWSYAKMHFRERGGIAAASDAEIATCLVSGGTVHSDYLRVIERWARHFGPDRFQIWFYDQIVEAPEPLFREVCAFIGVTPSAAVPGLRLRERIHAGEAGDVPRRWYRFLYGLHAPAMLEMKDIFRNGYTVQWIAEAAAYLD